MRALKKKPLNINALRCAALFADWAEEPTTKGISTMRVEELSGQDLSYWVSRANAPADSNRLRRHYGDATPLHEPIDEPQMRQFVARKFGPVLPERHTWQ